MFCYYGQHYTCLTYSKERGMWLSADDAIGVDVGSWDQVKMKLMMGSLQPSMLIYTKAA